MRMDARRAETKASAEARFTTAVPLGHAQATWPTMENYMAHGDDDTVYCHIQMPLPQGKELLQLITHLRESGAHPNLERVFTDILVI